MWFHCSSIFLASSGQGRGAGASILFADRAQDLYFRNNIPNPPSIETDGYEGTCAQV
jgi:hypothetical protein